MRKFGTLLLLTCLILSLSLPASAAEAGVVEYRRQAFGFGPGSLHYPTDLFPELKNVMPGDSLSQTVKIRHRGSKTVNLRLYIKGEGSDENADFIRQLQLDVAHKGGNILYEDGDAAQVTGWQYLATLSPGRSATLDLTLTVPPELGNRWANQLGTVIWRFKAEEVPLDIPKTGDNIHLWLAACPLSAAALLFLMKRKTQ